MSEQLTAAYVAAEFPDVAAELRGQGVDQCLELLMNFTKIFKQATEDQAKAVAEMEREIDQMIRRTKPEGGSRG